MNFFRKNPPPAESTAAESTAELRCSFCNKGQRYVKKLLAGPNVNICDECVDICVDIINYKGVEAGESHDLASLPMNCSICKLPFPIEEGLHLEARGILCPACVAAVQSALANNG